MYKIMVIEYKSKQKHILFQLFLKVIKLLMSLNLRSKSFHNFVALYLIRFLPIALSLNIHKFRVNIRVETRT